MPDSASQPASDLIVVGELNVDLIMERVQGLPELGKEKLSEGMTLAMGSSSAILAANAAALGVSVRFVGRIGADLFGSYVVRRLRERNIHVDHVIETPHTPTGVTVVFTTSADRGMLTFPGAMSELSIDDIPWDYVARSRHLHLSSYYLQEGIRPDCPDLFRRAREMGLSTSLDTNWDPQERWGDDVLETLRHVDIFFPNDEEAMLISGQSSVDAALDFFEEWVETTVVTCGARGVRARHRGETYSHPAFPVEVVDAIGAGDSFNAGFIARYLKGHDIEASLRYGLLTAAYSTTSPGGTAAFDDTDAFSAFAEEHLAGSSPRA